MEAMPTTNTYYKKLIDLVIELYDTDFSNAVPGHCMKITGFGSNELDYLWDLVHTKYPGIETFIIAKESISQKHISATKLIEMRNQQGKPLLVLIPSNSRTAAEDSYGNATFKEISLDGIEFKLNEKLINEIPTEYQRTIQDIFNYLTNENIAISNKVSYLIALNELGYNKNNIGRLIYHLNLIPDSSLIINKEKLRSRLNFNILSTRLISSFNKPLYDRIAELPLIPNTLQKQVVDFIKTEKEAKTAEQVSKTIYDEYPQLDFCHWQIPELDFKHIKVLTEDISSNDFRDEDGTKVLHSVAGKTSKVKIRFRTQPSSKDIAELDYFKIILMAVNGGSGEEIQVLRKLKNTTSIRLYKEATIELNSNIIEEGSYFFKVLAEDEYGNILNTNDDFKDLSIQRVWREELEKNQNALKSNFDFKLSCDSEDFYFIVEEQVEKTESYRKDKLNNVLQAYFKYRIEQYKVSDEEILPTASENSNIWLNDDKPKHTSTFHINYSSNHNYQINLSTKLRLIENEFLKNNEQLGYVIGQLNNNPSSIGFQSLAFIPSEITKIAPSQIFKLRKEIFTRIEESNENKNGIFETADIFNCYNEIKDYLSNLNDWTSNLREQLLSQELDQEQKSNLRHFLTELQMLDVARIKTKLPDGTSVSALLLSPLHPLRLCWFIQLINVFQNWEKKTREYNGYKDAWPNKLENLFDGQLCPENNPFVLVEPNTFKSYLYAGELAYGWGIYLHSAFDLTEDVESSIAQQLKHYFRVLFNITKDNFIETDISKKLIIRHLKNYLAQHPYTDKLIINLINAGDANVFADALVELEKDIYFKDVMYEIRMFKGNDKIIEHGEALRNLINPEFNVSEEAESFSQPSKNRLFPKLRFSINSLSDYISFPSRFPAHLSFLVSPFPVCIKLVKPFIKNKNFYLNGLITEANVSVEQSGDQIKWNRFIDGNVLSIKYDGTGEIGINLFENIQTFISGALASKVTKAIPATQLLLTDRDKVLIAHLHDFSDWVVTFDKNIGPQIFDQPSKDGRIPFLLDYVPGEEISGVSSYLTTRPSSEIIGLLGPHFEEFNLNIHSPEDKKKITVLLEDLRAVSSSLVMQLNSSKNKAFEVIGSAFTKRVLEKKGFLNESFLIPIDLHQNLFEDLSSESKSRADNLLVSIDPVKKEILVTVIEIKCRKSLGEFEKNDLKVKMIEQIDNTIQVLRSHFDPEYQLSFDRLDREIKNKELKSLLGFYIERAHRYEYLCGNAYTTYFNFLQELDSGFNFKFRKLGLIFDFAATKRHQKEIIDSDLTFFTFGGKLINDILDPDSDLNTRRLEEQELVDELAQAIGLKDALKPFVQMFKLVRKAESDHIKEEPIESKHSNIDKDGSTEVLPIANSNGELVNDAETVETIENSDTEAEQSLIETQNYLSAPEFDILIGKSSASSQYGILGESINGKKIAIDLSETNTLSLFGVQGGGKSYTIGTVSEMVLKQFNNINILPAPLAGVIFHYSESMDYEPEFTSMIYPNDKEAELRKLKEKYGAEPNNIDDVIILTPYDKIEERQAEFPFIQVLPILFNSKELNVQDWMFLLGAVGNDSAYIKQLKAIMKEHRRNITLNSITESVESSELLTNAQKALARQKLSFAREYIDDSFMLKDTLNPGRLIIVDLRDEFISKDEALGLFVIMLNIFSGVKNMNGNHFNKFIVFDEAHKYMDNKDLTGNIVTAIREMRHKGVSIMIASQDPPSLPNEIIELSSIVLLHKFNSPQWLKHIQKSITQLCTLTAADMSALNPGEGFLWATKATEKSISTKPVKISTRPRVTKHGGGTIQATGQK
jgi:DNA phosphorothioation-dependent restriction protein DptH